MNRLCARTGCCAPATASLSYQYATRQVWLDDIEEAPNPHAYDLCAEHANRLVVPRGWECTDRRSDEQPLFHVPVAS